MAFTDYWIQIRHLVLAFKTLWKLTQIALPTSNSSHPLVPVNQSSKALTAVVM